MAGPERLRAARGAKVEPLDPSALLAWARSHARVHIDVGTGDGLFVYRHAAAHPDTAVIGLDAAAEGLAKAAQKIRKPERKGGVRNAELLVATLDDLPGPMAGLADAVSVQYPWGTLLAAVAQPSRDGLARLAALARPGAELLVVLNYSVLQDDAYAERIGLTPLDGELANRLRPAYAAAGFDGLSVTLTAGDAPHRTSWGQRLVAGSGRLTAILTARRAAAVGAGEHPHSVP